MIAFEVPDGRDIGWISTIKRDEDDTRFLRLHASSQVEPSELLVAGFWVRGRFEIHQKVNSPRRAREEWALFRHTNALVMLANELPHRAKVALAVRAAQHVAHLADDSRVDSALSAAANVVSDGGSVEEDILSAVFEAANDARIHQGGGSAQSYATSAANAACHNTQLIDHVGADILHGPLSLVLSADPYIDDAIQADITRLEELASSRSWRELSGVNLRELDPIPSR